MLSAWEIADQGHHEVSACVGEPIVLSTVRAIGRRCGLRGDNITYIMKMGDDSGHSGEGTCRVVLCQ